MNEKRRKTKWATLPLEAETEKKLWIKYYVDHWKLDPSLLEKAFDQAFIAGARAACLMMRAEVRKEIRELRKEQLPQQPQQQTPVAGLGTSYPDDYFDPNWKSC